MWWQLWQCMQYVRCLHHVSNRGQIDKLLTFKFCSPEEPFTPERVYNMLMKNFNREYLGEEDADLGIFIQGNKAPWGLYMHAAWFFGNDWHYQGYKMFIQEITNNTKYPDVFIVPVEAGIKYMQSPMPLEVIINQGQKDTTPFGCTAINNQDGIQDFHCTL